MVVGICWVDRDLVGAVVGSLRGEDGGQVTDSSSCRHVLVATIGFLKLTQPKVTARGHQVEIRWLLGGFVILRGFCLGDHVMIVLGRS